MFNDDPESSSKMVQLIASKMQSANELEAMQSLSLLETCLENDCNSILAEIGKFRFLNEMIKLVSPKYLGNKTPTAVKNKIVYLLNTWSYKYPKEKKIKEAYEMLMKQGVVDTSKNCEELARGNHSTPTSSSSSSRLSSYEEDIGKSKMLQKLLRSNKPNDLKAANHLIKTMVKEKELKEDLKLIENNTKLLSEMLSNITLDSSQEDFQLIQELKETCVNMRPTLNQMISLANKSIQDPKAHAELFEINDFLNSTLLYYQQVMFEKKNSTTPISVQQGPKELLNNSNSILSSPPKLLDFDPLTDEDSLIIPIYPSVSVNHPILLQSESIRTKKVESSVDTLQDIFNSTLHVSDNNSKHDLTNKAAETNNQIRSSTKLFQDLDILGKSLLELPKAEDVIAKDSGKVTLNDLLIKLNEKNVLESSEFQNKEDELLDNDDEMLNGNETREIPLSENNTDDIQSHVVVSNEENQNNFIEPLSEVFVSLMEIRTETEKFSIFEDPKGVNVFMQLTENKPREDISVFLVLTNSRKSELISNFLFQPVVTKDCRLKLQPPSKSELPPYNPYIPVDTIVQIMLIATFKKDYIPLKFVISYNIRDEMITEMGEVSRLPLK